MEIVLEIIPTTLLPTKLVDSGKFGEKETQSGATLSLEYNSSGDSAGNSEF